MNRGLASGGASGAPTAGVVEGVATAPPPGSFTTSLALSFAPGGPRQRRSPSCSVCSPSTLSPFTNVPVALPASAMESPAAPKVSCAWWGSTLPSMICTSASMLDPSTTLFADMASG